MNEPAARRLALNLTAAALLAPKVAQGHDPDPKEINRAVELASTIDKAVRQRIRWELRHAKPETPEDG